MPIRLDGTDITGATIDGTDVQEITVDGTTVFTSGLPTLPTLSGTVFQWPFTEGSGTTSTETFTNTSGTFVNGVSWQTTAGAGGVYADTNDTEYFDTNLTATSNILGSNNRAFVAWIFPKTSTDNRIFTYGTGTFGRYAFLINNGDLRIEIEGTGYTSNLSPVVNQWQCVGVSLDGNTLADNTVYLDGATDSGGAFAVLNTTSTDIAIGAGSPAKNFRRPFDGAIDLATVSEQAASQQDFDDFRAASKGLYGL